MEATAHTEPNYMAVFWWLAILTVCEVGTTFLPIPHLFIGILLVGMAFTKALLVAMFFMHLRFERSTLGVIAVTPMLICVLLVFALLPDLGAVVHLTVRPAASANP